ncbi:unnamed protein product [Eruca vesicaria subsp. sativa]|uniref:Carbohydrate kinase FGGY N-terminal domain-containing protein n=1 Tax=Eruca vesicaria subsp. sativa TaxID=29727 RepID=A0ABC8ITK7_ERUVS|nr:unnamed protein product [Eruca vesicaria subsp. sativa]
MDSSTIVQCKEIENVVGGGVVLSEITGSRAYERYTGPQIRRLFSTEADLYAGTERISVVSSCMASLLIGDYASIDETDGAGMNLMDIKKHCWSKEALEVTATGLEEKLGKLAPAYATAGSISQYFVHRQSRDNPNSLAACESDSHVQGERDIRPLPELDELNAEKQYIQSSGGKILPPPLSMLQESFQRLLHKQDETRAEWEYPFAVADINISFMLAQI